MTPAGFIGSAMCTVFGARKRHALSRTTCGVAQPRGGCQTPGRGVAGGTARALCRSEGATTMRELLAVAVIAAGLILVPRATKASLFADILDDNDNEDREEHAYPEVRAVAAES